MFYLIIFLLFLVSIKIYNYVFLKIQLNHFLKNNIAEYIVPLESKELCDDFKYNIDENEIYSDKILETLKYYTLLPDNYDKKKKYPLLILLHGINDSPLNWEEKANLGKIYYSLLKKKQIIPMILVLPESGFNGKSWYTNWYKEENKRYEDFFILDLLDELKNKYNVNSFGITGFSMGGYGALKLALKNLDKFISVSSFAGAINFPRLIFSELKGLGLLRNLKINFLLTRSSNGKHFATVFGKEFKNVRKENVYYILRKKSKEDFENLKKMKFLLSVGEKDNSDYTMLYQWEDVIWEMNKRKLSYKARIVKNEEHRWSYVEKELPAILKFHSNSFMEEK